MKRRTWIAETLDDAGAKAQYDGHVKRILGSRQVLASILKGAVAEYKDYSPEEIEAWIEPGIEIANTSLRPGEKENKMLLITGDNTESKVPGEGTVTYDIRFRAYVPKRRRAETVKLLVNIEAQKKFYQKYRIVTRGIFYGARMLSEQLDREFTDAEYDDLKKVCSIWICMNAPAHIGNAMTEYRISRRNILGRIPERKASYDKLSVVIICLNEKDDKNQRGGLHGFLNTLLSPSMSVTEKEEILARDYGIVMEQEMGEELRQMCNLSEAIEEKGIEKGIEEGIEKGINLTKKVLRCSREGCTEKEIAELCGISVEKVNEIMED